MSTETPEVKPGVQPVTSEGEAGADGAKAASGPFAIQFPPDRAVWSEARRLVTDKNIRVEDLAFCAAQDPIIVIELLKISNAMFFAGGRSPITSAKTAIVRLGSDVVLDALEKIKDRPDLDNDDLSHWFEQHRSRCKRASIVATILSEALARTMSEDCQAVGLLMYIGEMLAVAHLKENYVTLAEELSRSGILYRLSQDYKFDVEKMGVTYLRRQGIPEALLFALDREARSRTADRAIIKPICMAAGELVEAFDANRWEKLAPGKSIPPKSALRMLQMNDAQYLKIYERASEYLFNIRMMEEKRKAQMLSAPAEEEPIEFETEPVAEAEANALQSEIEDLIGGQADDEESLILEQAEATPEPEAPPPPKPVAPPKRGPTRVVTIAQSLAEVEEDFSLKSQRTQQKMVPRVEKKLDIKVEPAPQLRTSKGNAVISSISNALDDAKTSEELLAQLLQMLVDDGPFEKSAIIVVSKDRKSALVVAARGPDIGNGQKIAIDDPLSPLSQCFSKVQSFGNKEAKCSPFGSKTFALAPIDADHDTPVALYADCGSDGAITFEARRIFRNVINILNEKLPQVPGGIPVEI